MSERDAYAEEATPFLDLAATPSKMDKETREKFAQVTGCACPKPMREQGWWIRCLEGWHFGKMTKERYVRLRMRDYDMDCGGNPDPERREIELKAAQEDAPRYAGSWWALAQCPEAVARWQKETRTERVEKTSPRGQRVYA